MKLTGYAALRAKELDPSVTLNHYETPLIEERNDISMEEARDIAHDDPGLIWADTVPDCVRSIIAHDPALSAWAKARDIPDAALYRISLDSASANLTDFEEELIAMIEPEPRADICAEPQVADALHYLVFADGSLLVQTNGQDEVWATAEDFIQERILGSTDPLDPTTADLLRHVGGYEEEIAARSEA